MNRRSGEVNCEALIQHVKGKDDKVARWSVLKLLNDAVDTAKQIQELMDNHKSYVRISVCR